MVKRNVLNFLREENPPAAKLSRPVVFVVIALAIPLINELYHILPPLPKVQGYQDSAFLYFFFFDAVALILMVFALQLGFSKTTPKIYHWGGYLFLIYGLVDLILALPFSQDLGIGGSWIMAAVLSPALVICIRWINKKLGRPKIYQLQEDLNQKILENEYLEFNVEELSRQLKSIGTNDINQITLAQAILIRTLQRLQDQVDLQDYAEILQTHCTEVMEAAARIREKSTHPDILQTP